MFRSNLAAYPAAEAGASSYVENVCRATLALFAAILAIAPVQSESKAAKPADSDRAGTQARDELYRLARDMESAMPNQAAELRYLAR